MNLESSRGFFVKFQGLSKKDLQFGSKGGTILKIWVAKGFSRISL
jgi:hypothetical protein